MYSAAVAAGMTVAFGAPMGAIMFSIEVATTYYMVSNLFKEFFCVCFAIIIYKIFEMLGWLNLYLPTAYPQTIEIDHEIFFFVILGIISGLFGALFIVIMTKITYLRIRVKVPILSERWKWCLGVGLVCGLMKFPVHFMMASDYKILNHMFAVQSLDENKDGDIWSHPYTPFNLTVYCIL
jgi:H+/Cl- antiporter ClcA